MTDSSSPKLNPLYGSKVIQNFEGETSLHQKIGQGSALRDKVFTEDKIAQCQQLINNAVSTFFKDNVSMIDRMEAACNQHQKGEGDPKAHLDFIMSSALSLRSQSDTLGFSLVSAVAQSLFDYYRTSFKPDDNGFTIVRKHLETMRAAFSNSLIGDGGVLGAELLSSLQKLIVKFSVK
jgi:hypothetical protein